MIGSADLQERKDREPLLSQLLDAQQAEANGFSLFYITASSPALEAMRSLWDYAKDQRRKGVLEVAL